MESPRPVSIAGSWTGSPVRVRCPNCGEGLFSCLNHGHRPYQPFLRIPKWPWQSQLTTKTPCRRGSPQQGFSAGRNALKIVSRRRSTAAAIYPRAFVSGVSQFVFRPGYPGMNPNSEKDLNRSQPRQRRPGVRKPGCRAEFSNRVLPQLPSSLLTPLTPVRLLRSSDSTLNIHGTALGFGRWELNVECFLIQEFRAETSPENSPKSRSLSLTSRQRKPPDTAG